MSKSFSEQAQDLFIQVMQQLGAHDSSSLSMRGILEDMCVFFGFGSGFIYEADHSDTFHLRESFSKFYTHALHEEIHFHGQLNDEEYERLSQVPVIFFNSRREQDTFQLKMAEIFNANSLLALPILNTEKLPVGLVGMVDRRSEILLGDDQIDIARSVLTVVANHVKLRVYRQRAENAQKALESMLDNMGIDVYVNDFNTHEVLYLNHSMAAPYGGREAVLGRKCWDVLYGGEKAGPCDYCPQQKLIDEDGAPSKVYSWDYRRPFDGSWFRVFSSAFHWVDGRLAHVVSSVDITKNKRNEEIIRQMAEIDSLTGLPNRRKLLDDLTASIDRATKEGRTGYVLFFDLDNFKDINDRLGHRAGDELLVHTGTHLQSEDETRGRAYRHGGDEFVLFFDDRKLDAVKLTVRNLLAYFAREKKLTDGAVACTASIGVAAYPADSDKAENLLHKADAAMYHAKKRGKGMACYYNGGDTIPLEDA